jgi:hypothetical protein
MGERTKGKDKGKAKKKPKAPKPGRRPHEQQRQDTGAADRGSS